MAAKGPRESITLECTECKRRNYMTEKNKRNKNYQISKMPVYYLRHATTANPY